MYYIIVWVACLFLFNTKPCYNHICTQRLFSCADHIHILLCTGCTVYDELQACFQAEVINAAMDCNIPEKNLVSYQWGQFLLNTNFHWVNVFILISVLLLYFKMTVLMMMGCNISQVFVLIQKKKSYLYLQIVVYQLVNVYVAMKFVFSAVEKENWEKVGTASVGL